MANILPTPTHELYASGTPVVTLTTQDAQPLIGENYTFTASFQNLSPVDPGFGPYIDLVFPVNGIDGNHGSSTADGTNFLSATYLGVALTATQLTFPAGATGTGCVSHPYARDSANVPLSYCGPTGDKLVVLQLPFGSFTPGQPIVDVTVNASLSNLADASAPLTIQARAGFQYGNDALNNPNVDPTIISSPVSLAITPTILRIRKNYNGPEDETATGPNNPRSYSVIVDLPNGMTVTNLDLSDDLPANMQYQSVSAQSPGGSSTTLQPSTLAPSVSPNNRVTVNWPGLTGGSGSTDASYNVNFYIPLFNASSTDVINPVTGAPVTSIDDIRAQAFWTPIDVRDTPALVTSNATAVDHTLLDTPIAVQKSSAIVIDTGPTGLTPGDTIEYTVVFQVSDFFALENVHATDTISDGQLFDGTFTPTFSFIRDGITTTGTMSMTNVDTIHDTPGSGNTYLDLDLSTELGDRAHADAGQFLGGCVPSGGGATDCGLSNGGLTSGTIKYRTVVQSAYTDDFPSGFPNVDQGDPIGNAVHIHGNIVNTTTLLPTGSSVGNGSSASLTIITGTLTEKTIYAVNGSTSFSIPVHISPGDLVTYRLEISQPTSNLDQFSLTDYLPLPIFSATTVTVFTPTVSAAVPPEGQAKFGPSDTFYASNSIVPTISSSVVSNGLTFDYGSNIVPGSQLATVADILFTVKASNAPFADGLFLTNQAQSTQGDTQTENTVSTQIVQLILNEPNLILSKGAVRSDSGSAVFSPTTVGPVTFQSPSGTCPAFTGTITSTNLASSPIGSSVSRIDNGDQVKFAMVLENTGNSSHGAFDVQVKDILPTGMSVSSTGLHLCVMRGDGTAIPYTDLGGGLFGNGIELTNVSSTMGSIQGYSATSGLNVAIITYDLTSNGATIPNSSATNTATLFQYAGDEDGPDFTTIDQTDSVNVTTKAPTISKVILGTNATSSYNNDAVVGEQIQYQVTVTIPEATSTGVTLVDSLPVGMAVVSLDSLTASSSIQTSVGGGFSGALSSAVITNSGRTTTITLGTVINSDTNNSATETVQFVLTAVMLNASTNQGSTTRVNQGTWNWTGNSISANAPTVTVREPVLTLTKTASPSTISGGETTTFTLTVAHASTSTQPAFDVSVEDLLPVNFAYVPASLVNISGVPAVLDDSSSTHLLATWSMMATGTNSVLQLQATAANNSVPSSTLINTAVIRWSTLQGDQAATSSSPYVTTGCERTGNLSQSCGTTSNDQTVTTTRSVLIGAPTISKQLIDTSATSTAGTNVAIGEILTYRVTIGIPDGTQSTGTFLLDTLPTNGLAIVDLQSISASGTLSTSHAGGFSAVLADASVTSSGASVSFPFENITNADTTTSTHESIVLTYRAVVLNTSSNTKGVTRNNVAGWTWSGGVVSSTAGNVTIAEPVLTTSLLASTSTVDAGDVVTYTLTVGHAGTSTSDGFDLSLTDLIPSDMTYVPGSLINVSGVASVLNDTSSTALGATWSWFPLASTSVIQFQAIAATSVNPGASLAVSSTLLYSSLQGDVTASQSVYNTLSCERTGDTTGCGASANTYRSLTARSIAIPVVTAVKALTGTSASHTAGTSTAIGEVASYEFVVTLPEGTAPSLVLHDFLPAGLQYVPGSVVVSSTSFGGTLPVPIVSSLGGNGDDVDVTFGSIVTMANNVSVDNQFSVSLQAFVSNVIGNGVGGILDNYASLTVGTSSSTSNHVALIIVEPDLQTIKATSSTNPAFGETVTFSLTVLHSGTSNADAYQPVITDLIPAGMSYSLGSAVLPAGWSVDESGNPTITFSAAALPFASSSAFITYQAIAASPSGTALGDVLTNFATTTWTSLPGSDVNERLGTGGVNDYFHSDSQAVTITGPDIHISKTDSGVSVSPSGTVTYAITYGNSGNGADSGVVLHETVPVGSVFNSGASTPGWSCANGSVGGTACDFSIGILGAGVSSTISFAVTALSPAASGLTSLSNVATITDSGSYTDPTPGDHSTSDTTPVDAQPDLQITKTDNATSTMPGLVVMYDLSYVNAGNQNAAGVTITDIVPANTTFYAASSSVGWSGCSNGSASGTVCTYSVGTLNGGSSVTGTVQFAVLVDYPLSAFTVSLTNTATIDDDGTNGTDSNLSNNTATDTDAIIQQGPEYAVTVDDGVTTVQPNQSLTLTYTITNNGNVNGTGVVVTSTISSYYLVDAISHGGVVTSTATGTQTIVWPGFSLVGGGSSVTRTITATLDPAVPTSVTSTSANASVADDGLNGSESYLVNNSSTDTDMVVFPPSPPTGGGGGGGPIPPPITTYQTITYTDGKPLAPPTILPPPQTSATCFVGCDDTTYDLSIINPDGSERRISTGYAQVVKISPNKILYRFEDKGVDFDYNDVLVEVDKTNCLQPVFTVKTVNARWHHQIKAEILVRGSVKNRLTLWTDSHAAVGQSRMIDASTDSLLCAAPTCRMDSCDGVGYQMYIINPNGVAREADTKFVKKTALTSTLSRFGFEDKGDDFDYNDVVVDVDASDCTNVRVSASRSDAVWHHQIRMRLTKYGAIKDDIGLWIDSHEAPGQAKAFNLMQNDRMCTTSPLRFERAGVQLQSSTQSRVEPVSSRVLSVKTDASGNASPLSFEQIMPAQRNQVQYPLSLVKQLSAYRMSTISPDQAGLQKATQPLLLEPALRIQSWGTEIPVRFRALFPR